MAPPLKVDTGVLRSFAKSTGDTSQASEVLDPQRSLVGLQDATPGTDIGYAAMLAGSDAQQAIVFWAQRLDDVAKIARGNGDNYDVTEDDFSSQLSRTSLDGHCYPDGQ